MLAPNTGLTSCTAFILFAIPFGATTFLFKALGCKHAPLMPKACFIYLKSSRFSRCRIPCSAMSTAEGRRHTWLDAYMHITKNTLHTHTNVKKKMCRTQTWVIYYWTVKQMLNEYIYINIKMLLNCANFDWSSIKYLSDRRCLLGQNNNKHKLLQQLDDKQPFCCCLVFEL